jgi:broad specificity phosphatase PhoE
MPRDASERKKLLGLLTSWSRRKKAEIRCALVRHAERADSCWDSDWCFSADARLYPLDPPLTDTGLEQAQATGQRLQRQGPDGGWNVVITSPYIRCVQTALEICVVTGAGLLIDQSWGEVHSAEVADVYGANGEVKPYVRPYDKLAELAAQRGVTLRNPLKIRGDPVQKENTQEGRVRYARKFLTYLERARLSRTSFIIVSHGECLPGCCPLFPNMREMDVTGVPFASFVVGALRMREEKDPLSSIIEEEIGMSSPKAEQAMELLSDLSLIDKTIEVRSRRSASRDLAPFRLPAWARSKQLKLRSTETLIEVLGLNGRSSFRNTSIDSPQPVLTPMHLVELPRPQSEEIHRSDQSRENHWRVGASTILLGDSFLRSEDCNTSLDNGKLAELVQGMDKVETDVECLVEKKEGSSVLSPRGAKAHQGQSRPQHGTARRGVGSRDHRVSLSGEFPRFRPGVDWSLDADPQCSLANRRGLLTDDAPERARSAADLKLNQKHGIEALPVPDPSSGFNDDVKNLALSSDAIKDTVRTTVTAGGPRPDDFEAFTPEGFTSVTPNCGALQSPEKTGRNKIMGFSMALRLPGAKKEAQVIPSSDDAQSVGRQPKSNNFMAFNDHNEGGSARRASIDLGGIRSNRLFMKRKQH